MLNLFFVFFRVEIFYIRKMAVSLVIDLLLYAITRHTLLEPDGAQLLPYGRSSALGRREALTACRVAHV